MCALKRAQNLGQTMGINMDVGHALEVRAKAQAAINRCALEQLLGRPNLTQESNGKTLRTMLKDVLEVVQKHNLTKLLPVDLVTRVEEVLPDAPNKPEVSSCASERAEEDAPKDPEVSSCASKRAEEEAAASDEDQSFPSGKRLKLAVA